MDKKIYILGTFFLMMYWSGFTAVILGKQTVVEFMAYFMSMFFVFLILLVFDKKYGKGLSFKE